MLRLLFYPSQYSSIADAELYELEWQDLKELVLREPQVVTHKGSEAQFFPGEMLPKAESKGDSSVDRLHLYCLDADGITKEQFDALHETIIEQGLECVVHSTFSHFEQMQKDGTYRIRVIFTLSRTVLRDEWRLFWSNCRINFGSLSDGTTAAPSKHFLTPSIPPGDEALAARIYKEYEGKPIDVDAMMSKYGTAQIANSEIEAFEIGKEAISGTMFLEVVGRKRKGDDVKIATALKAALGKNPYAETGTREATLFAIAGMLAKEFPRGNPDDICGPLKYSIEAEEKRGGPKYSEFVDKVVRRQRDILHRAAVARIEALKEVAKEAKLQDDAEEFTPESLAPYLNRCGGKITFEGMKDALVLVHDGSYYVFDGTTYVKAISQSLPAAVRKYLRYRAEAHLEFSYFYPSENGSPPTPKTCDGFVKDHGDFVKHVKYHYGGVSYYDKKTGTLWLSEVDSPSRIVPERVPEVETWMEKLCPDEIQRRVWEQQMALMPDTDRQLAGLVLVGPTGIGKSAYAESMAKLWGSSPPCSMRNYMSNFNSEIVSNALVFADENLPLVNGLIPTDQLRTLISTGTHEINRKGRDISILHGHVRTIISIQTLKKFDFGKGHSREDIEAIAKRFFILFGNAEAADYFLYDLFVTQGGLARHAMYLAQTMPKTDERFGVDTVGIDAIISSDPIAMSVVDWVVEYLTHKVYSSTAVKPSNKRTAAFVNKGKIFVNVTMVRKEWETYAQASSKKYIPSQSTLSEAIRSLSDKAVPTRIRMGSGEESFWELRSSVVKRRATAYGVLTSKQFNLLMKIPHELCFKTVSFKLDDEERKVRFESLKEYKGSEEEEKFG